MKSRQSEPAKARTDLRLLGSFSLSRAGVDLNEAPRKGLAMLAFLARRPGMSAPRATLVNLLWADSGDVQGRASLRQTILVLRRVLASLGHEGLDADATNVRLSGEDLWIDASAFQGLLGAATTEDLKTADSLVRGSFLEGFPPTSPEFDRWLDAERAFHLARHAEIQLRLAEALQAGGDTGGAIEVYQRLILFDPLQEDIHRRLMRAYLGQLRFDAALRQFENLKAVLKQDLGVDPDPKTLDLAREIRRLRTAQVPPEPMPSSNVAPPSRPAFSAAGRPSVAVLSFKSLSATAETALFGEAMAEEIIVELARESSLAVVSAGSSFRFDLDQTVAAEIGEKLGARYLLGGSVRIAGDTVRVTAHLVHCETGQTLWSERHDRELKKVFEIQTDLARTVTATVVDRIAEADGRATMHRPLESLESHSLAAQGYRHYLEYSEAGYATAIECFERAVQLDPDFARAHGLLSLLRIYQRWYFEVRSDVGDLMEPARRAIQIDNRDAKGHCALGLGHLILRDFDRSGQHFDTGLKANPNDDLLLIEHARYLMYVEQLDAALARVAEAMRLNPYHPNWYWNIQGRILHMMGRYQEALDAFQRVTSPTFWVNAYMAACRNRLGDSQSAAEARQTVLRIRPEFDLSQYMATLPYKNPETARRFFAEMGFGGQAIRWI